MELPIGYEDFSELIDQRKNFVDKTLFIKDVVDESSKVILITRPRRFGKTLNLSMLHYFFAKEVNRRETQDLFKELKIAQVDGDYLQYQGQYPVIFITLKDVKNGDFESACKKLHRLITKIYFSHQYLQEGLSPLEKKDFTAILEGNATQVQLENALGDLTEYLSNYYQQRVIVLIDEYDTPSHSAYVHGYYDDMIEFMRNFFSAALKTNPYLHKAVLTGVLRISKESIFTDLNNVVVYSILSNKYSEYFGFTEVEVKELLSKANLSWQSSAIQQWYNGYLIGNTVIYNPWSIANCINLEGVLRPYWVNTSRNDLIRDIIAGSNDQFKIDLRELLQKGSVKQLIDENFAFDELLESPDTVWTLLLMAGYLKVVSQEYADQGLRCQLAIPNVEVRRIYRQMIEKWLSKDHGIKWYNSFLQELLQGKVAEFTEKLRRIFIQVVSVHDNGKNPEAFYHGLLLGFTASLDPQLYKLKSNRESGHGRYDIAIIPKDPTQLGIIIECKLADREESLQTTAQQALAQINRQCYVSELQHSDIQKCLKLGIAIFKKSLAFDHEFATLHHHL